MSIINNKISDNINKLFKLYPVLKNIDKNSSGIIMNNGVFKTLEAGQYLSSLGVECSGTIFVISGVVKIQKINLNGDETNLYNIKSGDFCHEALSCIMSCESLNVVAKALTDAHVFIINMDITKNVLLKDVDFLQAMYKDIFFKFGKIVSNKETLIHESLDNRLVQLLLDKKTSVIYAKHSELAFEIDSTRETISRKLKGLENSGYISLSRGKISILKDLNELL